MNSFWWYLSRSSGIVATALIAAALVAGLRFSGRSTGTRRRPNWWLDLHNQLGGLAFVFTGIHLLAVYKDSLNGMGLKQLLVPMTAGGWTWGITWGVIATYVFAAVVFTSWPRRIGSRTAWLTVHLMSIPAAVMVGAHAWMVGTSRGAVWFQALLAVLVGAAVYPGVLRVFTAIDKRRRVAARGGPAPTPTHGPRPAEPARTGELVTSGGGR